MWQLLFVSTRTRSNQLAVNWAKWGLHCHQKWSVKMICIIILVWPTESKLLSSQHIMSLQEMILLKQK